MTAKGCLLRRCTASGIINSAANATSIRLLLWSCRQRLPMKGAAYTYTKNCVYLLSYAKCSKEFHNPIVPADLCAVPAALTADPPLAPVTHAVLDPINRLT